MFAWLLLADAAAMQGLFAVAVSKALYLLLKRMF